MQRFGEPHQAGAGEIAEAREQRVRAVVGGRVGRARRRRRGHVRVGSRAEHGQPAVVGDERRHGVVQELVRRVVVGDGARPDQRIEAREQRQQADQPGFQARL